MKNLKELSKLFEDTPIETIGIVLYVLYIAGFFDDIWISDDLFEKTKSLIEHRVGGPSARDE